MDELTIHGLPRVHSQTKWYGKVFWASIFICCCGFLFQTLRSSVAKFREYPYTVKIEREAFSKLPFPKLTICDTDRESYQIKEKSFPANCFDELENRTALFKHGCKLFLAGFQGSCIFDSAKDCSFPVDFTPTPHWQFCYTINTNGSMYQTMPERSLSFHLMMFKNESELFSTPEDRFHILRSTQLKQGLVVHIHSTVYKTGIGTGKIVNLIPGYITQISLRKVVYHRLKTPYHANCTSIGGTKDLFGGKYSLKNCLASCFFYEMYNRCGDVLPDWRVFVSEDEFPRRPKMNDMNRCFMMVYEALGETRCDCPNPCNEEVYETQVHYNPLRMTSISPEMNRRLAKFLNVTEDKINLKTYKENVVRLDLSYDTFTVKKVLEHPLSGIEDLLSGFGGLMGLLTGASTISIIELLFLFVDFLRKKIRKEPKVNTEKLEC